MLDKYKLYKMKIECNKDWKNTQRISEWMNNCKYTDLQTFIIITIIIITVTIIIN